MSPRVVIAIVVAVVLFAAGAHIGGSTARAELRATKAEHAATLSELATRAHNVATLASEAARKTEHASSLRVHAITETHSRELSDAYSRGVAAAAALRAGRVELRPQWAACPPAAAGDVPGAAAAAAATLDELRSRDYGRLVELGGRANADLAACWRTIDEYRAMTGSVQP